MPSPIRSTTSFLLLSLLMAGACSSPTKTSQRDPVDPAADSVDDGLIPSDTTVVDDDTLQVVLPVQPKPTR